MEYYNRLADEAAYFAAVDAGRESAEEELAALRAELTSAKEEIERLKAEKEDMRQHCIHCIDDPDGDLCSAVTMLEAAESALTAERKETERLREVIRGAACHLVAKRMDEQDAIALGVELQAALHPPQQEEQ